MLKHSRTFLAWACFVFVIAAFALIGALSPSYQKCATNHQRNYSQNEQSNLHEAVTSGSYVPLFLVCEGAFIDENNGTLTVIATFAIAGFTLTLWRATNRQAGLTRDAIELGNKDFVATHRPRLKVRRITVVGFHARIKNAPLMPGEEINASLEIVNVGASEATIIWSRYRIYFGKDDYAMISHYVPPHALAPTPVTLHAGQPFFFELVDRVSKDIAPSGTLIRPIFGGGPWNMFVIGEVRYQDRTGSIRHLGFCREMHRDHRFRAINDPEYEYED
jgi:hypothetical protein